jgi:Tol biopolymer transport system component/formylglycine-generating enzyme required for sulfatase activity
MLRLMPLLVLLFSSTPILFTQDSDPYVQVDSNADWDVVEVAFYDVPMVLVPAGCFVMGTTDEEAMALNNEFGWSLEILANEQPAHEVCFDEPFWVDKTEVSQADFARLGGVSRLGAQRPGDDLPMEQVFWSEAHDFCELRGGRLPTTAEWEYVARGPSNFRYPWGNEFDASLANGPGEGDIYDSTAPVGSFPEGASWVGALDMSGNVMEWVSTIYAIDDGNRQDDAPSDVFFPYPYRPDDGREEIDVDVPFGYEVNRYRRGGAYRLGGARMFRSAAWQADREVPTAFLGFRCVRDYEATSTSVAQEAPPISGLIAYSGDVADIYLLDLATMENLQLTDDVAIDTHPVLSPDGTMIAFERFRGGQSDIYIMNSDGDGLRPLVANAARPSWSPDGTQLVFESTADNDLGLFVVAPDGQNRARLLDYGTLPAWSPDGESIAFVNDFGIYVMNADGSSPRPVVIGGRIIASHPTWSPDSTQIAFHALDSGRRIYTVNADGTDMRAITNGPEDNTPSWSPDGAYIVFASVPDGNLIELYTIDLASGTVNKLLSGYGHYPSWRQPSMLK